MGTKKKIYYFNNGGRPGWYQAVAIAEDGTDLAGHICSSESFMHNDMGATSNWKHEKYNEYYGVDGWELEWVPGDKIDKHEGLQRALKLNEELSTDKTTPPTPKNND